MDWAAVAAISGAVVAAATILGLLVKHARPRLTTARLFIQNLIGIPANPIAGQARVPGLFERLDALSSRLDAQDQTLGARLDAQDETLATLGRRLTQQDTTLAEQDKLLSDIHHEVHFNNGSSVKDAVTRIEARLKGDEKP